jgi:hypothetical protein
MGYHFLESKNLATPLSVMSVSETNKYTEQHNGKYLCHCLHVQCLLLSPTEHNGASRIILTINNYYRHTIN